LIHLNLSSHASAAFIAITWFGFGANAVFVSNAFGFCAYAVLTIIAMSKIKASPAITK
jgi:hypothetical protein